MNQRPLLLALTQMALFGCAIYMATLVALPWLGLLGIAVVCVAGIAAHFAPAKSAKLPQPAWAGTLLVLGAVLTGFKNLTMDSFHAILAGQIALIIFLTANRPGADKTKSHWNLLGVVWGFIGTAVQLTVSYADNLPVEFCIGLAACLFLLILCRLWFHMGAFGIQTANTLILLLVLLPVTDLFLRLKSRHDMGEDPAKYYTYEAAKKNPSAFARWARYNEEEWGHIAEQVMRPDPAGVLTFRLRPDSSAYYIHCLITINHQGYRGPEIPDKKGNAYRIVALGESTTFGMTMNRGDRPWPELLEQMIRERLNPTRPVQVINAGIPAATLPGNLVRLTNEILSLEPDMIISYHGYNAFNLLDKGMPPIVAKPPPPYKPRPLHLLGDLEYSIKLTHYKKNFAPKTAPDRHAAVPPMESDYAKAYRQLIQIAQTNNVRLVLANYSMAVNPASDPAVIAFFEQTAPSVRNAMAANLAHSEIVRELSKEHPEICFVDTHPAFDGRREYFTDLVHFTQPGRQQMAETFFAGIRKTLEADLARGTNTKSN